MTHYAHFLRTRRPLWDTFETSLDKARRQRGRLAHDELETLAFRYRQVLHDHALAASRYPATGAARRLRRLALDGTHWLQWDRAPRRGGLLFFVRSTFPAVFRRFLPHLGVVAALFLASSFLGLSLAVAQPGVGVALLGPETIEGLRQGRLWTEALTTTIPPAVSTSAIATNNMSVAIAAWAGGALAGLGTLYVVLLNGFLLGAVVGATLPYGLSGALLGFVAAHGPLEISLILVCSAAGLALGQAVVAASDRPRAEVLQETSRAAFSLLLGCLPWFVVLGLVEGFVSPAPTVPVLVKTGLGLTLLALFSVMALGTVRAED